MQSEAVINQQMMRDQAERSRALKRCRQSFVQRLLGCWQHDLSRPFTREGKTYRVCTKCGLSRDFNLNTFKTHGVSYTLPPKPLTHN
jgi:hypothetical protein